MSFAYCVCFIANYSRRLSNSLRLDSSVVVFTPDFLSLTVRTVATTTYALRGVCYDSTNALTYALGSTVLYKFRLSYSSAAIVVFSGPFLLNALICIVYVL